MDLKYGERRNLRPRRPRLYRFACTAGINLSAASQLRGGGRRFLLPAVVISAREQRS